MVLIRKHYFVEHLESLRRRQRSRTKIENRLLRLVWRGGASESADKPEILIKSPTPGHTMHVSERIGAHEGIGAALVGGGSAGIGLGIALSKGTANGANEYSTDRTAAEGPADQELQSPKSLTPSFEFVEHEDSRPGIMADVHSFTSSPRSGFVPLPGPFSPGGQSDRRTAYSTALSPRSMRYRPGKTRLVSYRAFASYNRVM